MDKHFHARSAEACEIQPTPGNYFSLSHARDVHCSIPSWEDVAMVDSS